ncbi:MAG: hypothetical protein GDA51_14395 [Ekhidna sp.]|nr:hypothetical protein [Ekhidna sp.]
MQPEMGNDYSLKIEKLKGRRYDEALKEFILSEAFHHSDYSDCIKYTLESMLEIDPSYAYKVYAVSGRVHEKIAKELKKRGFHADYRYQGELKTYSNILLYGDVEIVVIKKNIKDKPYKEIQMLAMELMDILQGDLSFKSLEYSDRTRIKITTLKPTCEISILPSVWINSQEYKKTKNEIYRGIAEFDFKHKKVKKYLPFLNIARINAKDQKVKGNLKSISRLLKTLRADNERKMDLNDAEINAIVYNLSNVDLRTDSGHLLTLLPVMEEKLNEIYINTASFNELLSPSGKDRIFAGRPDKKAEVGKLKTALSELIEDLKKDLEAANLTLDAEITYAAESIH